MAYRDANILAVTDKFEIHASVHDNGLSIEFRLYEHGDDEWDYGGFLKWDGCLNWQTNPDCFAHFCNPAYLGDLVAAFEAVGRLAIEHMPKYEGNFGRPACPPLLPLPPRKREE